MERLEMIVVSLFVSFTLTVGVLRVLTNEWVMTRAGELMLAVAGPETYWTLRGGFEEMFCPCGLTDEELEALGVTVE